MPPSPPSPTVQTAAPGRVEFLDGVITVLPAVAAALPFGFLLGALAAAKGLSPLEMGLMSGGVFAGGAQFVALDLWTSPAAWLSLGFTTLVVNVRHVLMGTSLVRNMARFRGVAKPVALFFLADEIWAFAERRAAERPLTPAFYAGTTVPMVAGWLVSTVAGTLAGAVLGDPKVYGFDFAFIAIFIGLLAGFRHKTGFLPAVLASAAAATLVHLVWPGPASIAAGAVAGVAAAALTARTSREAEEAPEPGDMP